MAIYRALVPMVIDPIRTALLPYSARLEKRVPSDVDLVVIHCTELPDLQTAREYGERIHHAASGTGNCGHLYIDRDGRTESWVELDRVAHHTRGYNQRSIGIELVNEGRWPDWLHSVHQDMSEPYPEVQIEVLLNLIEELRRKLPALRWIEGHENLDREKVPATDDPARQVFRKRDPGPLFPWRKVLASSSLERLAG